jgi:hypothetical protein
LSLTGKRAFLAIESTFVSKNGMTAAIALTSALTAEMDDSTALSRVKMSSMS